MLRRYIPVLLLAAGLIFFFAFARQKTGKTDFEQAKEVIAMRMIGHDILLYAGDSTSRVLPVKQVAENKYQLPFENRFVFEPDSLVRIIRNVITHNGLSTDYIVNVINCSDKEVIYGYAMLDSGQNNIIPCNGRKQPKSCYYITIQFPGSGGSSTSMNYFIAGCCLLALVLAGTGLQAYYRRRTTVVHEKQPGVAEAATAMSNDQPVQIGKFLFNYKEQYLLAYGEKTALTAKESAMLYIFAMAPNQVIDRSRLQKELWEDEGVIVGRSLDMFVSKLRKKLESDPSVSLVNIHGKGYKLETK